MKKKYLKLILLFTVFCLFVIMARTVLADDTTNKNGLLPVESNHPNNCQSSNCGGYTLNDMMSTAKVVADYILGIVGSLALLFFIYGGLVLLLSAGSSERVKQGQQIIIGAVVGLVIVFTSYMIIQFVYQALGLNWQGKQETPQPYTGSQNFYSAKQKCLDEKYHQPFALCVQSCSDTSAADPCGCQAKFASILDGCGNLQ